MRNKTIVITGNRKGIGRYLTEYYTSIGLNVVGCSRNISDFKHKNYLHIIADVKEVNAARLVLSEAKRVFGTVDVLINNAGIASMNHFLLTPNSSVDEIFRTNFLGTFSFSREFAKHMKKNRFGRIVNFSSIAVPLNLEGELVYSSSKAAVEKMTKIMAAELSDFGITVNAIGPTPIYTDLIKTLPKVKIDELIQKQVIKRMGNFQDVLNVINFFISKDSDFVTGQIIYLGGL